MKKLLLVSTLGAGLILPPNQSLIPPPVIISAIPGAGPVQPTTPAPEPQVAVIPAAIGIGVAVGVLGWAAFKVLNGVLNIWEKQVTNEPPAKVDFPIDYP